MIPGLKGSVVKAIDWACMTISSLCSHVKASSYICRCSLAVLSSLLGVLQLHPSNGTCHMERGSLKQGPQLESMKPNEILDEKTILWPTGFRRSMHLGAWLSTLTLREPQLEDLAVRLMDSTILHIGQDWQGADYKVQACGLDEEQRRSHQIRLLEFWWLIGSSRRGLDSYLNWLDYKSLLLIMKYSLGRCPSNMWGFCLCQKIADIWHRVLYAVGFGSEVLPAWCVAWEAQSHSSCSWA